jgi:hypothetical protein
LPRLADDSFAFASARATRDLLETEMSTHVALDLNLGDGGARFEFAHLLKKHGMVPIAISLQRWRPLAGRGRRPSVFG